MPYTVLHSVIERSGFRVQLHLITEVGGMNLSIFLFLTLLEFNKN